jgi:hypothetical protein
LMKRNIKIKISSLLPPNRLLNKINQSSLR